MHQANVQFDYYFHFVQQFSGTVTTSFGTISLPVRRFNEASNFCHTYKTKGIQARNSRQEIFIHQIQKLTQQYEKRNITTPRNVQNNSKLRISKASIAKKTIIMRVHSFCNIQLQFIHSVNE